MYLPSWERWSYGTGKCNAITWFIFQRSFPNLHRGQTFKTTLYNLFFPSTIAGEGSFCPFQVYNIKPSDLRTTFKPVNMRAETVAMLFFINKQPHFCLSSLYTGAGLTTASRARSRRLWFHLTTGSQRIPLHEIFFSCWIWSICGPVISVDHSLA